MISQADALLAMAKIGIPRLHPLASRPDRRFHEVVVQKIDDLLTSDPWQMYKERLEEARLAAQRSLEAARGAMDEAVGDDLHKHQLKLQYWRGQVDLAEFALTCMAVARKHSEEVLTNAGLG